MIYPIDADTGLLKRPPAARFPLGPSTIDETFASADPEKVALIDRDRHWNYRELEAETAAIAAGLRADGVSRGDRVVWSRPNEAELVLGFIATIRAGAIWVGLNPRLTSVEQQHILADCSPSLVVRSDTPLPHFHAATPLVASASAAAAIGYTSGTTGQPKGAVHAHQQLLYPGAASIATEPIIKNEVIGTPLTLTTLNLMLLGPLTAFARGTTAATMKATDPDGFATEIARHQVTRTLLVPTLLHDLLTGNQSIIDKVSSLRTILLGGAGAMPGLRDRAIERLGVDPIASYGLSEAPTGVARTRQADRGAEALPGITITVADDGEVVLRPSAHGPWAQCWNPTLGYWRQPDATARLFRSGGLHTGDIGSLDANGDLTVVGRASEMINRGGANVAPTEVERALLRHPHVTEAVVFAVADHRLGHAVAAAVVVDGAVVDDADVDVADIAASTRDVLAGYKVPATLIVLEALPRTAAGKIDRQAVAANFDR